MKWYRSAALLDDLNAQFNLGVMLSRGRGVPRDDAEAARWFRAAARRGDATAQFAIGALYAEGRGVEKDEREAVRWYRAAAAQGHAEAQNNLGSMYERGRGVRSDLREAARWYRQAAEGGDATGQFNLGLLYESGRGVPKDEREAARWLQAAAEQGLPGRARAARGLPGRRAAAGSPAARRRRPRATTAPASPTSSRTGRTGRSAASRRSGLSRRRAGSPLRTRRWTSSCSRPCPGSEPAGRPPLRSRVRPAWPGGARPHLEGLREQQHLAGLLVHDLPFDPVLTGPGVLEREADQAVQRALGRGVDRLRLELRQDLAVRPDDLVAHRHARPAGDVSPLRAEDVEGQEDPAPGRELAPRDRDETGRRALRDRLERVRDEGGREAEGAGLGDVDPVDHAPDRVRCATSRTTIRAWCTPAGSSTSCVTT